MLDVARGEAWFTYKPPRPSRVLLPRGASHGFNVAVHSGADSRASNCRACRPVYGPARYPPLTNDGIPQVGDGRAGLPAQGPFHAIHVGAAAPKVRSLATQVQQGLEPWPPAVAAPLLLNIQTHAAAPLPDPAVQSPIPAHKCQPLSAAADPACSCLLADLTHHPLPSNPTPFLQLPHALIEQLAPGGAMICPVGPEGGPQEMVLVEKHHDGRVEQRAVMGVIYVPLCDRGHQLSHV